MTTRRPGTDASLPGRIGRYEIEAELGRGMMGVIYRAHDPDLGRTVALKTVALAFSVAEEDREAFKRRFLEEARIAARLSHPGIVVVHEVGRDGDSGVLYMALEYLRGRTLAQIMTEEGRLPWEQALRVVGRVADALHHAHAGGVVHRDIKPANIMILESGEPKLLDFGVAKAPALHLTAAGQFFGTPAYMSPEQACGLTVDGRSDLFSLGCVLYQVLTGQTPFTADNIPLLLSRILHDDPALPSALVADVPEEVDVLMARLLAKDRRQRYQDGRQLTEAIDDILNLRPLRPLETAPALPAAALDTAESTVDTDTLDLRLSFLLDEDPAVDAAVRLPVASPPSWGHEASPSPADSAMLKTTVNRRPAGPLVLAALAVATMVAVFAVALRNRVGEQSGTAALVPAVPPFGAVGAPVPAADVAVDRSAPGVRGDSAAPASAIGSPPAAPSPSPSSSPSAAGSARLHLRFDHHIRSGVLRAWVDDALRLERPLRAARSRDLLVTRLYRGRTAETLEVPPGRHRVRVEVAWEGRRRSAQAVGHFASGQSRQLEVTVGILRRTVELHWRH